MNDEVRILKCLAFPYNTQASNGVKFSSEAVLDFAEKIPVRGFHGGEDKGNAKFYEETEEGLWWLVPVFRDDRNLYHTKAQHLGVSLGFAADGYEITWGNYLASGVVDEIVLTDKNGVKNRSTLVYEASPEEIEFYYSKASRCTTKSCVNRVGLLFDSNDISEYWTKRSNGEQPSREGLIRATSYLSFKIQIPPGASWLE